MLSLRNVYPRHPVDRAGGFFNTLLTKVQGLEALSSQPAPASSSILSAFQFDQGGKYFDPKATRETPRWIAVDVHGLEQGRYLSLSEMRAMPELVDMVLLQKGSRLSISPVTASQWKAILKRVRQPT